MLVKFVTQSLVSSTVLVCWQKKGKMYLPFVFDPYGMIMTDLSLVVCRFLVHGWDFVLIGLHPLDCLLSSYYVLIYCIFSLCPKLLALFGELCILHECTEKIK